MASQEMLRGPCPSLRSCDQFCKPEQAASRVDPAGLAKRRSLVVHAASVLLLGIGKDNAMHNVPHLEITKTDQNFVARRGNCTIILPNSINLRDAAIADVLEFYGPDCKASHILADCDFEFEVAPGEDLISDNIGLVIITSTHHAEVLESDSEDTVAVMSSLMEVCPDIGASRVVVRGRPLLLSEQKFEVPDPVLADHSPESDEFVRNLTAMLIAQGRTATAFCEAARWGHLGVVQEMLAEGIDVNVRSEHGSTALIHASSAGQLPIVRALLAAGADVNTLGNKCTPLIANLSALHSERTYLAICNELLNAGADLSICDHEGRTAQHWAESRQFESLTNLIRSCPRGE
jgi:hypothetical protein